MSRSVLFRGLPNWDPAPFLAFLAGSGYTQDGLAGMPSALSRPSDARHAAAARAMLAALPSEPLGALVRRFSLGGSLEATEALRLFGWQLKGLETLGLLVRDGSQVRSKVRLMPHAGSSHAGDFREQQLGARRRRLARHPALLAGWDRRPGLVVSKRRERPRRSRLKLDPPRPSLRHPPRGRGRNGPLAPPPPTAPYPAGQQRVFHPAPTAERRGKHPRPLHRRATAGSHNTPGSETRRSTHPCAPDHPPAPPSRARPHLLARLLDDPSLSRRRNHCQCDNPAPSPSSPPRHQAHGDDPIPHLTRPADPETHQGQETLGKTVHRATFATDEKRC